MKDVHIALSGGCVRLAYPGENVLDFTDNLSFGPLYALDDDRGLQTRSRWFQDLHHSIHAPEWDSSSQRLTAMENLRMQLSAVSGQMTLWISDNPDEQLMLRALLPLLGSVQCLSSTSLNLPEAKPLAVVRLKRSNPCGFVGLS